jgi:hypothetical protein
MNSPEALTRCVFCDQAAEGNPIAFGATLCHLEQAHPEVLNMTWPDLQRRLKMLEARVQDARDLLREADAELRRRAAWGTT